MQRVYWQQQLLLNIGAMLQRRFGVLFQSGALWSSLTLSENIMLPMTEIGGFRAADARELAAVKLALVGLAGFEDFYPSEISGGMKKRAALARAMALDPDILFFDEPSAGLDPLSSAHLDELILELRDSLGATIVIASGIYVILRERQLGLARREQREVGPSRMT